MISIEVTIRMQNCNLNLNVKNWNGNKFEINIFNKKEEKKEAKTKIDR